MARRKNQRKWRKPPRIRKRSAPGSIPGTLAIPDDAPAPAITVIKYNETQFIKEEVAGVDELKGYLDEHSVTWVNVDGLGDANTFRQLAKLFGIHGLAMEDVVNVHQRAKVETYDDHVFIVLRMISIKADGLDNEQVSIFLGKNFVITIQQRVGDCFDSVRARLSRGRGRIRKVGADYLAYALIDAVIDSYFPVVDQYGERMEQLEEQLARAHSGKFMELIHHLRSDLMVVRRAIRPLRDVMLSLRPEESALIKPDTGIYLRDCYDHTIQLLDLLDTYREMCSNLRDYQMSLVSNRMNEIMKVLTIIGTIFIPLSFISGLYGMNFDTSHPANMPELSWPYGYEFAIGLMALVAISQLIYFWRRGWFSSG